MWSLRRASKPFKFGRTSLVTRSTASKLEISSYYLQEEAVAFGSSRAVSEKCSFLKSKFYCSTCNHLNLSICGNLFSSQAGAESGGEEDELEDDFSKFEAPAIAKENMDTKELFEAKVDAGQRKSLGGLSKLFQVIVSASDFSVDKTLDKWVEEGNDLSRAEISSAMFNLRKRRMYGKALQLSDWLESKKEVDFLERDYVSRLDLIAKVRGINRAQSYIDKIPESFRGEVIYGNLLANCVSANNVKKAEEVFNKMKDLEFPITSFVCNQLLLLYKRNDKKKIADVLLLMGKENVKPTLFTYKILIEAKRLYNDITGMGEIVETMKAEGVGPDVYTLSSLAKHYASGGFPQKAEEVLKEMEDGDLKANRWACRDLLLRYAELGKSDEVGRIWDFCQSNTRLEEYVAAIEAWGKLKKIEESEAVFEKMLETWKKPSSKHFAALLKVYSDNNMLEKGKDLVKRMGESGCMIGPLTCDALVKFYVEAGEVEKADCLLHRATKNNQMKPLFDSYMSIMDAYAKRGDIHNTEKLFHRTKQVGYVAGLPLFQSLVRAYINAKLPVYGIWERMKADNIFADKAFVAQVSQVDAFGKTAVSAVLSKARSSQAIGKHAKDPGRAGLGTGRAGSQAQFSKPNVSHIKARSRARARPDGSCLRNLVAQFHVNHLGVNLKA